MEPSVTAGIVLVALCDGLRFRRHGGDKVAPAERRWPVRKNKGRKERRRAEREARRMDGKVGGYTALPPVATFARKQFAMRSRGR